MPYGASRLNTHGHLIDRNRRLYYTILIIIFEFFKIFNNQSTYISIINSIFGFYIYSFPLYLIKPIAFIINSLEITECIAWFYTKEGLTVQVINSMDITWAYNHHFELIYALIIIIVANTIIIFLPIPSYITRISSNKLFLSNLIVATLFYIIFQNIKSAMDPFSKKTSLKSIQNIQDFGQNRDLMNFLRSPIQFGNLTRKVKKPNLMILEIESLEFSVLGTFSVQEKEMMPFTSSLVQRGTYFRNVISQPYTTWSVASMFCVQCNMPLLIQHVRAGYQGKFHLSKDHKCIGDFLNEAGYKLLSYQSNFFIGDFKRQMELHKWQCFDVHNHNLTNDWDLFDLIGEKVFKSLENEKKPFVLHIANSDCHAIPRYHIDRRCERRLNRRPPIIRSFDCVDQILEKFFKKFEHSKLFETTEVIVYGDHILMSGNKKRMKMTEPRSLVLSFPYREKKVIYKNITLYDFAPSIMNMLGVQYSPMFPFGSDLFSNQIGHPPDINDFELIYNFFTYEYNWDKNITCWNGQKGFCTYAKN